MGGKHSARCLLSLVLRTIWLHLQYSRVDVGHTTRQQLVALARHQALRRDEASADENERRAPHQHEGVERDRDLQAQGGERAEERRILRELDPLADGGRLDDEPVATSRECAR